jgi:hypothetical protein
MLNQLIMPFAESSTRATIPWWVVVILIIILLILLWFWFGRDDDDGESESPETREANIEIDAVVKPDDLKKIEGIGPKVSSLLNDAGITTFQQMVEAGADKLEKILDDAALQMINADTWPEQAKMAAAGDWETLDKLQDELKGGKRA